MGKFVRILNADSQNICTCQLFSFWALFYATASPVFIQTGMKSAFSYTQCLRPEHRWPRSSPRFCLLFLGNSSTHQRKWAAKRIRRLTEWYDCLLAQQQQLFACDPSLAGQLSNYVIQCKQLERCSYDLMAWYNRVT